MDNAISELIRSCEWGIPKFFIFSSNVFDPLIYYSHILPLVISITLGIFIFLKGKQELASRILFGTIIFLSVWIVGDLTLWATDNPNITMFAWSLVNMVEPIIYAGVLYFLYLFIDKQDISLGKKIGIFILLIPTLIFTPTKFALMGFDLTNCDRDAIEGPLVYYGYFIEIVFIFWILFFTTKRIVSAQDKDLKNKILFVTIGSLGFLIAFAFGNIIGSLFDAYSIGGEDYSWTIGQYGLFGIPIFIGLLSYIIVKYKTFNTKLIGTQALVVALAILIGSSLLVNDPIYSVLIIALTLILVIVLGYFLVRSVKREVTLRESLQVANAGQENLIHIINHQIKGYLAKGRNIFSELLTDNMYGPISEKAKPMLDEGFKSLTEGVEFTQNILKSSNAAKGTLQYNMEKVDFKKLVLEAVEKEKVRAEQKNLSYEASIEEGDYEINADASQMKEAIRNLIDNSIIYTNSGGIKINLFIKNDAKGKKIIFKVKDTGIGINPEDKGRLFTKGGRGKDSIKTNVNSTGFGLAFVKGVVEAHKGTVSAESEGIGHGSTFSIDLPIK